MVLSHVMLLLVAPGLCGLLDLDGLDRARVWPSREMEMEHPDSHLSQSLRQERGFFHSWRHGILAGLQHFSHGQPSEADLWLPHKETTHPVRLHRS